VKRKIQRLEMTEGNYAACAKGLKVQTRRVVRDVPKGADLAYPHKDGRWEFSKAIGEDDGEFLGLCKPRYAEGDIAALTLPHWRWVGFGTLHIWDQVTGLQRIEGEGVVAEHALPPNVAFKRMAARYMPVWACLHFAEIMGVRAERLGEISCADLEAEGLTWSVPPGTRWIPAQYFCRYPGCDDVFPDLGAAYRAEWDALHGAGAWDPDDWVWVLDFKLCDPPSREAMADSGPEPTSPSIASATEGYEGQGDEP